MSFVNDNIKAARKASGKKQEEVANALGVPRSTYATWEGTGDPGIDMIAAIAKLFGYKYSDLIDENFIDKFGLGKKEGVYKSGRKAMEKVIPDADSQTMHDILQLKAMLRVSLRNQAQILARLTGASFETTLEAVNEALKAESSDEFDAL